jgi:hypothetical protein
MTPSAIPPKAPKQALEGENGPVPMPPSGLESKAAFARRLGVNRSTITRWDEAGRLVLAPNGKVFILESQLRLNETGGTRPDVSARHAANRGAPLPSLDPAAKTATEAENSPTEATFEDIDAQPDTRAGHKARLLYYENALLKLGMALRRGGLLQKTATLREAQALGQTLRAALERAIDQTAPALALATDPELRRDIVRAALAPIGPLLRRESVRGLRRIKRESRL